MINYTGYDIKIMEAMDFALETLDYDKVSDEDVWVEARLLKNVPQFENILLELSFDRLSVAIDSKYSELNKLNLAFITTDYNVDLRNSTFTIFVDDKSFQLKTKESVEDVLNIIEDIKSMISDEEIIG